MGHSLVLGSVKTASTYRKNQHYNIEQCNRTAATTKLKLHNNRMHFDYGRKSPENHYYQRGEHTQSGQAPSSISNRWAIPSATKSIFIIRLWYHIALVCIRRQWTQPVRLIRIDIHSVLFNGNDSLVQLYGGLHEPNAKHGHTHVRMRSSVCSVLCQRRKNAMKSDAASGGATQKYSIFWRHRTQAKIHRTQQQQQQQQNTGHSSLTIAQR